MMHIRFIGDKYDYSKVNYVNTNTKVCIVCKEHGEFWQKPVKHLMGHGCPICNESKLEKEINDFLIENNIQFERQKHFDWLGLQSLDFYLPKYNVAIECQGIQHFKPIDFFGGEKGFKNTQDRDNKKLILCGKNNINIIYFSHIKEKNIINDKSLLLKTIMYGK